MQTPEAKKFGNYLLHERIGAGGMAEIFLASDPNRETRPLVIKRLHPDRSEDTQFVKMFVEEARLCVYLNHPNVVRVFDLGEIDSRYFIAMEYVHGRDLLKTLAACAKKRLPFPTDLALYIVMEVLQGLDYAHNLKRPDGRSLGIIHRDVSPSNVLLSFEGEVKLGDFGIAKATTREKTATGILKGKLGYMAPEQVQGLPIDHRADVFAVGILLYELLTGHRLFAGHNDLEVLERVRDAIVSPSIRHYRPDLADELEAIAMKALDREPERRFQTTHEFARALSTYIDKTGVVVTPRRLARFLQDLFLNEQTQERPILKFGVGRNGTHVARPVAGTDTNNQRIPKIGNTAEDRAPLFGDEESTEGSDSGIGLGELKDLPRVRSIRSLRTDTAMEFSPEDSAEASTREAWSDLERESLVQKSDRAIAAKGPLSEVRALRKVAEEENSRTALDLGESPDRTQNDLPQPELESLEEDSAKTALVDPGENFSVQELTDEELEEIEPDDLIEIDDDAVQLVDSRDERARSDDAAAAADKEDLPETLSDRSPSRTDLDLEPHVEDVADEPEEQLSVMTAVQDVEESFSSPIESLDEETGRTVGNIEAPPLEELLGPAPTTRNEAVDSDSISARPRSPRPPSGKSRPDTGAVRPAARRPTSAKTRGIALNESLEAVNPPPGAEIDEDTEPPPELTTLGDLSGAQPVIDPTMPRPRVEEEWSVEGSSGIGAAVSEAAQIDEEIEQIRSMSMAAGNPLDLEEATSSGELAGMLVGGSASLAPEVLDNDATGNIDHGENEFAQEDETLNRDQTGDLAPTARPPGRLGDAGASDLFGALALLDKGKLDLDKAVEGAEFDDDESSLAATMGIVAPPWAGESTQEESKQSEHRLIIDGQLQPETEHEHQPDLDEESGISLRFDLHEEPTASVDEAGISEELLAKYAAEEESSEAGLSDMARALRNPSAIGEYEESEAEILHVEDLERAVENAPVRQGSAIEREDTPAQGLISESFDLDAVGMDDEDSLDVRGTVPPEPRIVPHPSSSPPPKRSKPPAAVEERLRAAVAGARAAKELDRTRDKVPAAKETVERSRDKVPVAIPQEPTKTNYQPLPEPKKRISSPAAAPRVLPVDSQSTAPVANHPVPAQFSANRVSVQSSSSSSSVTRTAARWATVIAVLLGLVFIGVVVATRQTQNKPMEIPPNPEKKMALPEPPSKEATDEPEKETPPTEAPNAPAADPTLARAQSEPTTPPKKAPPKEEPRREEKVAPKPAPAPKKTAPKRRSAPKETKSVRRAPKPRSKPKPKEPPKRSSAKTGLRVDCREPITLKINNAKHDNVKKKTISAKPRTYRIVVTNSKGVSKTYSLRVVAGQLTQIPCNF